MGAGGGAYGARALSRSRVVQRVHTRGGAIVCVSWSRSGAYVAAAGRCGSITLFAALAGGGGRLEAAPHVTLDGHGGDVLAMAWSASGFLASASTDHSVRLWHPRTATCLRRFVHPDMVTAVAFHPHDDNCLATGGCDGVARLWRPAAHAVAAQSAPGAAVSAARFAPDGDSLHVGRYDGSLVEHDVRDALARAAASSASSSSSSGDDEEEGARPQQHEEPDEELGCVPAVMEMSAARSAAPARRRARPGAAKVCAIAQTCGELLAVTADGRAHVFGRAGAACTVRLRRPGKRGGGGVQRSVTADGRFLVGDGDGGEVLVADLGYCRAAAGGLRRLVREASVPLESVAVMKEGCVSAAEFGSEKVVEYVLGDACVKGAVVLAVGGDDGVLRIVTNVGGAQERC